MKFKFLSNGKGSDSCHECGKFYLYGFPYEGLDKVCIECGHREFIIGVFEDDKSEKGTPIFAIQSEKAEEIIDPMGRDKRLWNITVRIRSDPQYKNKKESGKALKYIPWDVIEMLIESGMTNLHEISETINVEYSVVYDRIRNYETPKKVRDWAINNFASQSGRHSAFKAYK